MSIIQRQIPEPPRPPPPPRTRDVLVCNGCGTEVEGPEDGAVWTLPSGWARLYVTGERTGPPCTDLCPRCRTGATIRIPSSAIAIPLEAAGPRPPYNHSRGDSALTPCPECAALAAGMLLRREGP